MNADRVARPAGLGRPGRHADVGSPVSRAIALAVAGAAASQTPNTIEQVSVTRGASGNTIVRFS